MIYDKPKKDLRCPVCLGEFTLAEQHKRKYCKRCGSTVPLQALSEDGYVKINWQDLRVLATYSRRWTKRFDPQEGYSRNAIIALDNILNKLRNYRPQGADPLMDVAEERSIRNTQERAMNAQNRPLRPVAPPLDGKLEKDEQGRIKSPFYQP